MPITPADIRNVRFRTEFRGYAQDEVDAFLTAVEQEVVRLIESEGVLRAQLADRTVEAPRAKHREPEYDTVVPITTLPTPVPTGRVSQVLELATEAADRHIAEAEERAAGIIREAQERAGAMVAQAQQHASTTKTEAEQHAARVTAQADQEARERTAGLESTVATLEVRVEELRTIAEDYQANLAVYLQDTLNRVREIPLV